MVKEVVVGRLGYGLGGLHMKGSPAAEFLYLVHPREGQSQSQQGPKMSKYQIQKLENVVITKA